MPFEADPRGVPTGFPLGFGEGPGEADALLLLRCLLGITPRAVHVLAWRVGPASACLEAIRAGAAGSDGDREYLTAADVRGVRRALEDAGARFAPVGDQEYWPAMLRLTDPPVGVFLRGRTLTLGQDRVAVVGTRRATALGREVAMDLARGLVACGVGVVSGGAIGIDAAAHRGALDAGGLTVAVLGSGIDVEYPPSNAALLQRVAAAGTLVSEYPPGVPAEPFRFPARNRLIAALSRGVVIVEGAHKSGTRITAEHAVELGLDVFAVPGPVTSPLAETPLELIRDGATLIRGAGDLLADLGLDATPREAPTLELPEEQRRVYDMLETSLLPEAVARLAGVSMSQAVATLIQLELRGLVRGVGGRFERTFAPGSPGGEGSSGEDSRQAG